MSSTSNDADQVAGPDRGGLVRSLGRWGLTALTINCVVGAGILGLPGKVYALAGASTGWVVAGAAILALAAALCLAELGSRMEGSGGPVEYCTAAFGPVAGFAAGWLLWAATVLAAASLLNLFATMVASDAHGLIVVVTGLGLTALTCAGMGRSAIASGALTVLKLGLLVGVAIAGLTAPAAPAALPTGAAQPVSALILMFFAFVGFERPTAVAGEVVDARRAVPFALLAGMAVVTALYAGVIAACWRGVPDLALSERPVGDLLGRLFGNEVARGAEIAAAVIVLGTLVSQWITAPRLMLALSENRQLPSVFGRIASGRGTPDVAIVTTGIVAILLALGGDFVTSIAASSASRLLIFMGCAAALLRLRRRRGIPEARFHLPLGAAVATCVILVCAALLVAASSELARLGVLIVVGGLLWLISNGKRWFQRV